MALALCETFNIELEQVGKFWQQHGYLLLCDGNIRKGIKWYITDVLFNCIFTIV